MKGKTHALTSLSAAVAAAADRTARWGGDDAIDPTDGTFEKGKNGGKKEVDHRLCTEAWWSGRALFCPTASRASLVWSWATLLNG